MTEKIPLNLPDTTYTEPGQGIETVEITLDNFLATADVSRAFGEPVQHDDTTILPCAEVLVGMGFGAGFGSGPGPAGEDNQDSPKNGPEAWGGGGGGGGGGRTLSRPVAVVVASTEGVRVEPIVDPTKIALAAITAVGFMFTTLMRMKRGK